MEYLHNYIIVNGKELKNQPITNQGKTVVYEILRIEDKIPLFLEKHFHRFVNSTKIINKKISFSISEFKNLIEHLIYLNKAADGNIKITVEYIENYEPEQSIIGFIPHSYPTVLEYNQGVKIVSTVNQRYNPAAKVWNDILRTEINNLIKNEQAYEAALIHPEGYITEGSRSNIFFIKDKTIITAPDEQVLSGITRENIKGICKESGYKLLFETLKYNELDQVDAAFLTGTSPKVLPIKSFDNYSFRLPNEVIQEISKKYDQLILAYKSNYIQNTNF